MNLELNKVVSLVIEEGIELLRLIYNEAKDEFGAIVQNKPENDDERKNVSIFLNFNLGKSFNSK